ncbi:unnamed protein product [Effrenium voratum]|nr:unnamed protein product [Effrenium voratum]
MASSTLSAKGWKAVIGGGSWWPVTSSSHLSWRSAAHLAARSGHAEALRLLHNHGCEMEAMDRFGRTALHLACEHGKADVVKVLLDCGARPGLEDKTGRNALHLAACCEDPSLCETLASQFPQLVFCADSNGRTPLFYAALNAHPQAQAEVPLLQNSANINHRDCHGKVALHHAAEEGQLTAVRLLLKNKIDANAQDKEKQTALQMASSEAVRRELIKAMGLEAATAQPHPSAASSHHPAAKPLPGKKANADKNRGDSGSLPPLRRHPLPAPDVLGMPFQQLQSRFVQLMERVQQGGLDQMLHVTRPQLFNGSWMRDVSTHQQLLGQALKYVPGPEVCLRVFNLLHPPKTFPSVQGDECAIMSYYDEPKRAWQGADDPVGLGLEDDGITHGRRVELLKAIRDQRQQLDMKDEQLEEQRRRLEHFQEELARCLDPDEAKLLRNRLAKANAQVTDQTAEIDDAKSQVHVLEGQVSVLSSRLKEEADKNTTLVAEQCALRRQLEAEHALRGEQKSWQDCFEQEQRKAATLQLRLEAQVREASQKQLAAETEKQQLQEQVKQLQELAKTGQEALAFKAKADKLATELQAAHTLQSRLQGELLAVKQQRQGLQTALDEATYKAAKVPLVEQLASAAEQKAQQLQFKLQVAEQKAAEVSLLQKRLADKQQEMESQDRKWNKILTSYPLVGQLLFPAQSGAAQGAAPAGTAPVEAPVADAAPAGAAPLAVPEAKPLKVAVSQDEAAAKQAATLRTAGFTQASQSVDASASPQSEPQGSSEQRGQTQELPMNTLQQVLGAALDSAKLQASATAVISQDEAAVTKAFSTQKMSPPAAKASHEASSDLIALSGPSPGGSATPAEADAGPAEEADATPKAAQLKRSACQDLEGLPAKASSDLIALSGPSPGGSATPAEADAGPAEEEDATPKAAQLKRSACQDWEGLPAKASSDLIALSGPSPGGSATPAEADAGPAEEADATPKAAQLKRSACQDLEGLPAKASSDLIALSGPSPGGSATPAEADAGPAEEADATPKAAQLKRSVCQDLEGPPTKASSDLIALSSPSPGGSATPAEADAGPAEEADATPKAAQLKRSACQDLEGPPAKDVEGRPAE